MTNIAPFVNGTDEIIVNSLVKPFNSEQTPYEEKHFDPRLERYLSTAGASGNSTTPLKVLKVVLVGDLAVGKTSLIHRFCHKTFNNDYKPTIGCDFEIEKFTILNQPVTVQFWDTAGQERFRCIAAAYYRNAQCIILTFDLTKVDTLLNCSSWLNEALKVNSAHRPLIFLVGTKRDCLNGYEYEKVEELALNICQQLQAEYWPTSSKSGENVQQVFSRAASLAFQRSILSECASSLPQTVSKSDGIPLPSPHKRSDENSTVKVVGNPPKKGCCSLI